MIRLRYATIHDLDDIMEIERACFPKSIQASRSTIAANLRSPTVSIIVADAEGFWNHHRKDWGKVVGCIIIFYRINSKKAYIDSTAVLPKWWNRGIATQLKDWAVLDAYERDTIEIHTDVATTNKKMLKLNESLGYKITSKKLDYYGKGKHAFHMVRNEE